MFALQVYVRSIRERQQKHGLQATVSVSGRQEYNLFFVSLLVYMFTLQVYVRSSSLCSLFKSMFALQVYVRSSSLCSLFKSMFALLTRQAENQRQQNTVSRQPFQLAAVRNTL